MFKYRIIPRDRVVVFYGDEGRLQKIYKALSPFNKFHDLKVKTTDGKIAAPLSMVEKERVEDSDVEAILDVVRSEWMVIRGIKGVDISAANDTDTPCMKITVPLCGALLWLVKEIAESLQRVFGKERVQGSEYGKSVDDPKSGYFNFRIMLEDCVALQSHKDFEFPFFAAVLRKKMDEFGWVAIPQDSESQAFLNAHNMRHLGTYAWTYGLRPFVNSLNFSGPRSGYVIPEPLFPVFLTVDPQFKYLPPK